MTKDEFMAKFRKLSLQDKYFVIYDESHIELNDMAEEQWEEENIMAEDDEDELPIEAEVELLLKNSSV